MITACTFTSQLLFPDISARYMAALITKDFSTVEMDLDFLI